MGLFQRINKAIRLHAQAKTLSAEHFLLLLIIVGGTVLRFFRLQDAPMTFDEFSAFFRTGYQSFGDLIREGVMISDMHPAGVQVFLYYWIRLAGAHEWLLKLPFIVAGILSIYLVYRIGSLWFNPTVGLFASLYIAFLQYPVTYSILARPYSFGLFFALMMVWMWTNAVFRQKRYMLNLAGFTLFAILCSYTHYFSMMFAGIAGITGLFFIPKRKRLSYLLAGMVIVVAFLPHLPITLHQLTRKGVGSWLGKPHWDFYTGYVKYILHFSPVLYILTLLLIVSGILFFRNRSREARKFRWIAFFWITIPMISGFAYSHLVNPVLQYSVLIFVYPFIPLLLLSFWKNVRPGTVTAIILIFTLVAVNTLVLHRKHFTLFYPSGYRIIIENTCKAEEQHRENGILHVLYMPEKILTHYLLKTDNCTGITFIAVSDTTSQPWIRSQIEGSNATFVTLGWAGLTNPVVVALISEYFPYLVHKASWYHSEFYLFSKVNQSDSLLHLHESEIVFFNEKEINLMGTDGLYSPGFSINLNDMIAHKNNNIVVAVNIRMKSGTESLMLVSEIKSEEKTIDWRSVDIAKQIYNPDGWNIVYLGVKLADIRRTGKDAVFRTYIWNPFTIPYDFESYSVRVTRGNPVVYLLFEDY